MVGLKYTRMISVAPYFIYKPLDKQAISLAIGLRRELADFNTRSRHALISNTTCSNSVYDIAPSSATVARVDEGSILVSQPRCRGVVRLKVLDNVSGTIDQLNRLRIYFFRSTTKSSRAAKFNYDPRTKPLPFLYFPPVRRVQSVTWSRWKIFRISRRGALLSELTTKYRAGVIRGVSDRKSNISSNKRT